MKKYIISFGFIWIVIWCFVGLYHGALHESFAQRMLVLAQKGDLLNYWKTWETWKQNAVIHSHGISFAFLNLFMGFIWTDIKFSEKIKNILGIMAITGTIMAGVFGTLDMLVPDAIGDVLLLVSFISCTAGYIKGINA